MIKILNGNSLEELKKFPDNYFHSVVTDPPYGLSFMGKKWDYDVPSVELWQEVFRVLKEGGYLLSFSGTRTQHRMAVNIEDAGFEIRDMIAWVYGSGFPKSHNIGKAVDKNNGKYKIDLTDFGNYIKEKREVKRYSRKELDDIMGTCTAVSWWEGRKTGVQLPSKKMYKKLKKVLDLDNKFDYLIDWAEAEREVVGKKRSSLGGTVAAGERNQKFINAHKNKEIDITIPKTEQAKQWEGWGTALKPALEPITMARKPFKTTVANNVLKNGVGGINIDGCRVGVDRNNEREYDKEIYSGEKGRVVKGKTSFLSGEIKTKRNDEWLNKGRFPANFIHDGSNEVKELFPYSNNAGNRKGFTKRNTTTEWSKLYGNKDIHRDEYGDKGSAARFFYCAKASKQDRNEGLEDFEEKISGHKGNFRCKLCGYQKSNGSPCKCENPVWEEIPLKPQQNNHPTVKPTDLMRYLVRLVTPKNGIVLDCFMGSGSTGKACALEGVNFVGIDLDKDYCKIAKARIDKAIEDKRIMDSQTKLF